MYHLSVAHLKENMNSQYTSCSSVLWYLKICDLGKRQQVNILVGDKKTLLSFKGLRNQKGYEPLRF